MKQKVPTYKVGDIIVYKSDKTTLEQARINSASYPLNLPKGTNAQWVYILDETWWRKNVRLVVENDILYKL